jgi:hypothetical protein
VLTKENMEKVVQVVPNTNQTLKKESKPKPNYKYMRDKDREMVKGIFRFHEVPGGTVSFPFKAYKEDSIENYTLTDGQVYSLPLGVARHLNKNCWYPVYDYIKGENFQGGYGLNTGMKVSRKVRRMSFQSLEFVDVEDLTPDGSGDIVTVERIGQ